MIFEDYLQLANGNKEKAIGYILVEVLKELKELNTGLIRQRVSQQHIQPSNAEKSAENLYRGPGRPRKQ